MDTVGSADYKFLLAEQQDSGLGFQYRGSFMEGYRTDTEVERGHLLVGGISHPCTESLLNTVGISCGFMLVTIARNCWEDLP